MESRHVMKEDVGAAGLAELGSDIGMSSCILRAQGRWYQRWTFHYVWQGSIFVMMGFYFAEFAEKQMWHKISHSGGAMNVMSLSLPTGNVCSTSTISMGSQKAISLIIIYLRAQTGIADSIDPCGRR